MVDEFSDSCPLTLFDDWLHSRFSFPIEVWEFEKFAPSEKAVPTDRINGIFSVWPEMKFMQIDNSNLSGWKYFDRNK